MQIINVPLKETIDLEMLDEFRLPWDRRTIVSFEGRHPKLKDWEPHDLKVKADGSRSYTLGVYGEFCCGLTRSLPPPAQLCVNADALLFQMHRDFYTVYKHPTGIISHPLVVQIPPEHVGAGVILVRDTNIIAFGTDRQSGDALAKETAYRKHAVSILEELGYVRTGE